MKRLKVLVIDDETIVLDSVRKVLADFEVDLAQSSRQGLDWGMNRDYDLVLTDIRMPEIGGMRILRDIKRAKPAVPVVIITGYATVQSAVQAMKLGAADYIEKPFTPDMLLTTVRKALEKAASSSPRAPGGDPQGGSDPGPGTGRGGQRVRLQPVLPRGGRPGGLRADRPREAGHPDRRHPAGSKSQVGPLTAVQKRWLESRLGAEIW